MLYRESAGQRESVRAAKGARDVVTVRILGPLEVVIDRSMPAITATKERLLLAILASRPRQQVSLDRIVDDLWPTPAAIPTDARASVQVLIARLRRHLGVDADRLISHGGGYSLVLDDLEVDARRFLRAYQAGRDLLVTGDADGAVLALREGLDLWRGGAYEGLRSFTTDGEASRLNEARLGAWECLFEAELETGNHGDLLTEVDLAIGKQPFHERFWAFKITALYRSGRQAEALGAYEQLRVLTRGELGTEPTPELQRLAAAVREQDPTLGPARSDGLRVVVADDDLLVRTGIAAVLRGAGHQVVGEAGNLDETLAVVAAVRPDVAVIDIRMPPSWSTEGLEAAERIRSTHPGTAVVVLSQYLAVGYAERLMNASTSMVGYVLKSDVRRAERLTTAIAAVAAGGSYVDEGVVNRVLGRAANAQALDDLAPEELQTLAKLAVGLPNEVIASLSGLDENEVESLVRAVSSRIGIGEAVDVNRRLRTALGYLASAGRGEGSDDAS